MDVCTVNTLFSTHRDYNLLLAQPSLCQAAWSTTPWRLLFQQPGNILRFTSEALSACSPA